MSKISVVVVAYNVKQYIEDAVKSVQSQTMKDIEILIVDDSSTDGTSEILTQLATTDARVRVIRHEENRSAMQARKTGIAHASGDYVMLLDGDDMLAPDACEKAWNAITTQGVDMLQFDTMLIREAEDEEIEMREQLFLEYLRSPKKKIVTESACGLLGCEEEYGTINFTVWNKIYRTALLKTVNEYVPDEYLNLAEDVLFSFLVQHEARSYGYLAKKLCHYRFGIGISTRATMSEKQLAAWAKCAYVYRYLEDLTKEKGTASLCEKALQRIKTQMLDNISSLLFYRILPEQKDRFLEEVQSYCSDEDLILSIADYTYRNRALGEDVAAQECATMKLFSQTKPKKVRTIGAYYFRMYNGGVENVISSLSAIWVKHGYEVVIFTDEEPSEEDYPVPSSVRRITVPSMKEPGFDAMQKRIREFRKAILESGIDVMVYNAWINPWLLLDEMIIKSCGVALTVHTHNLFCFDAIAQEEIYAYRNTALGAIYQLADSIVTLTDVDTAWWQALGVRAIKTINPIQLPLSVERSKLSGHQMLMVCRISPEKQVLDAIKVAQLVKERVSDAKLTIVGKGDHPFYVEMVENYVKDNGLEDLVTFAGFDANVLPYYQRADVLLSTSRYEGFGLVLMESKICGMPMVLYELANLDICSENQGMLMVPQGDIRAAADAVVKIFSDEDLKKQLGQQARESAERLCSVDLAERWDKIFEQTLLPKPPKTMLSERSPLEIAVNLAAEYHTRGLHSRSLNYAGASNQNAWQAMEQCRVMSEMLDGISKSESYRLGLFLTAIPRRIRNLFRRKKQTD